MKINDSLVTAIINSNFHHAQNYSAGEIIQDGSKERCIILVTNGTVRYIDSGKTFNSFTIKKEVAPLIIGIPSIYNFNLREHIVAADECSAIIVDKNDLSRVIEVELSKIAKA